MRLLLPFAGFCLFLSIQMTAQPEILFAEAENLYQKDDYEGSLATLEHFVDAYPDRKHDIASAYFLMSANFMKLEELDGAVWANQQSLELRNKLRTNEIVENCLRFGEIYLSYRQYDDALDHLLQAAEMPFEDPSVFADINFRLAEVYHALGNWEEAEKHYYRTSQILSIEYGEINEKLIPVYLQRARLALITNNFDLAVDYFATANQQMLQFPDSIHCFQEPLLQILAELGIGKYNGETSARLLLFIAKYWLSKR